MFGELIKLLNTRIALANQLKLQRTRKINFELEQRISYLLKNVDSDFKQVARMQLWCKEEISLHQKQVINSCCSSIKERALQALSLYK